MHIFVTLTLHLIADSPLYPDFQNWRSLNNERKEVFKRLKTSCFNSTLKTIHFIPFPKSHLLDSLSTCMPPWWHPSEAVWADCSPLSPGPPESLLLPGITRPGEVAGPGLEARPAVWGSVQSDGGVRHLQRPGTASDTRRQPLRRHGGWKGALFRHLGHPHRCIRWWIPTERRPGCEQASDWLQMQQRDLGLSGVAGVALCYLESWRNRFHLIRTIKKNLMQKIIYLINHQISQRTQEPYGAALNSSGHGSNQSWDKDPPTALLAASAEG